MLEISDWTYTLSWRLAVLVIRSRGDQWHLTSTVLELVMIGISCAGDQWQSSPVMTVPRDDDEARRMEKDYLWLKPIYNNQSYDTSRVSKVKHYCGWYKVDFTRLSCHTQSLIRCER